MGAAGWHEGYDRLAARLAGVPASLRATAAETDPPLGFAPAAVRRFVTSGVGSSEAHARFLAHLLADLGLDARYLPLSALQAPPDGAADDVLVLVSQGLQANARLALAASACWRRVVVLTAVGEPADDARRRLLADLARADARVLRFAGEDEYGTLVRVIGPLAGYVRAYRLTETIATAMGRRAALPALDIEAVLARIERAPAAVAHVDVAWLAQSLAFVTTGGYDALVANLRYKVLEGMLLPAPPVWDVLHVAHGPFQQAFPSAATFVALARADARGEAELLDRLERMLEPGRHRLVRLTASLPGPLAILEHEAQLNALLLRWVEARHVDQVRWPGRGREGPLYDLAHAPERRRLAELTWPEVEALLARGCRTAVVPLGSTEQHGPHLPAATDTWIADALAERFTARVPEAIQLPALAVGCSVEHLAFPGTLDLRPETLVAVIADVLRSLARHGFAHAFVFSAHGGNAAALRAALPALREAGAPVQVIAFTDLARLTSTLAAASAACGVSPEASGHHAGELETSIVLGLRPTDVRVEAMAPGLVQPTADPQALFYPSLRTRAPDGTVGDPSQADAARATRYLDAWVDLLVEAYRGAKNRQ